MLAVVMAAELFQGTSVLEQFRTADKYRKLGILGEAVQGKLPASQDEIRGLVSAAFKDEDALIRSSAVETIGAILLLSAMPTTPPGQDWAVRLKGLAQDFQPQLAAATKDPSPSVRRKAFSAIVAPEAYKNRPPVIPLPLIRRLAEAFGTDPDNSVRTYALQSIVSGHAAQDPEAHRIAVDVLLRALDEDEPYLIQAAGLAATRMSIPEALPKLVKQLKNPSHIARTGVAQGIAAYGAAARQYLPDLRAAVAVETDAITRKTIEGTITVITR